MHVNRVTVLLLVAGTLLAACANAAPTEAPSSEPAPGETTAPPVVEPTAPPPQAQPTAEGALPEVNPLEVTGDITTAGSSTVFPLSERMAERFEDEGYAGKITIDSIGTGAGFERFCVAGESDISNASRPIKDSEVESCRAIGREPVGFRVGTDALAIAVSAENNFVDSLTLEQLALVFSTAETWAEVDSSWPAEPILNAPGIQLSEDDNVLVQGVLGSPFSVGYFGYAYYQENADTLKVLSVEGVEPTAENVDNGSYPLARPLFIYSDAAIIQTKPQVASFINFYLTFVNEEVLDVGYFPASPEALDAAKTAWLQATGMGG